MKAIVLMLAAAKVLCLTPVPQEFSTERKYVDSVPREYNGTVGDFKLHTLKCTQGNRSFSMSIYFTV